MKLIKRSILIALIFIMALGITGSALEPPYSFGSSDPGELQHLLVRYITDFPAGPFGPANQPASRADYLEERRVLWPSITDPHFVFQQGTFRESSRGSGVNSSWFTWIDMTGGGAAPRTRLSVSIYYEYADPMEIYQTRFMHRNYAELMTLGGIYNGLPYFAHIYTMPNGDVYSVYNMVVLNLLVRVFDPEPFSESRMGLLRFDETGFILPVYVGEERQVIERLPPAEAEEAEDENNPDTEQPVNEINEILESISWPGLLLSTGVAAALVLPPVGIVVLIYSLIVRGTRRKRGSN